MATIGTLSVTLTASTGQFVKGLKSANMALAGTAEKMKGVGAAAAIMSAKIGLIGGAAVKTFGDFESAMVNLGAISNTLGTELFGKLEERALELGESTRFSASEVAAGMTFMAQAGVPAEKIYNEVADVLDLAAASSMDLARAADIATNVQAGFANSGRELADVGDVLFRTTTLTNTNMEQLAQAMSFVGPVADSMGVSIEETAAVIGTLSNAGIQAGRAGTSLRGVLSGILGATGKNVDVFEALGFGIKDGRVQFTSLKDTLEKLQPIANDTGLHMQLFGDRAGPSLTALLKTSTSEILGLSETLEKSAGFSAEVAAAKMDTFNGSMAGLRSKIEGAGIALGEQLAPHIEMVGEKIKALLDRFLALDKSTRSAIGKAVFFGGVIATLGVAVAGLGFVLGGLSTAFAAFGTVAGVVGGAVTWLAANFQLLNAAVSIQFMLWGPLIATISTAAFIIVGIGAGIWALIKLVDELTADLGGFSAIWDEAFDFGDTMDTLSTIGDALAEPFVKFYNWLDKQTGIVGKIILAPYKLLAKGVGKAIEGVRAWFNILWKVSSFILKSQLGLVMDLVEGLKTMGRWVAVAADFWKQEFGFGPKQQNIKIDIKNPPEVELGDLEQKAKDAAAALEKLANKTDKPKEFRAPGGKKPKRDKDAEERKAQRGNLMKSLGERIERGLADIARSNEKRAFEIDAGQWKLDEARFEQIWDNIDKAADKAAKEAAKPKVGNAIGAAAEKMVDGFGEAGSLVQSGIEGAQAGGPWGAVVAVLTDLAMMTEGFSEAVGSMNEVVKVAAAALSPLMSALSPIVEGLNAMIIPLFRQLGIAFALLAPIITAVGDFVMIVLQPIFSALGHLLEAFAPLLSVVAKALRPIITVLAALFTPLLEVFLLQFNILSVVMGQLTDAIEWFANNVIRKIVNFFVNQAIGIFKALFKVADAIPGLGKVADSLKATIKKLRDSRMEEIDLNKDVAKAADDVGGAMEKAAEETEKATAEIKNAPSGFKIAIARFRAAQGMSTTPTGGALGADQLGAASQGLTQYQIDSLNVMANDPEELAAQLEKEAERKSVRTNGLVTSNTTLGMPTMAG